MSLGRRTFVLLAALAIVGAPAVLLRAVCAGHSCDEPAEATADVPFCSLPERVREPLRLGFREGRSPDVLAVAAKPMSLGSKNGHLWWPQIDAADDRVPIALEGTGVTPGTEIPSGTRIDSIAPTLAALIGLHRPHPEVRSGTAIDGLSDEDIAGAVVEVVWKGVGSADLEAEPDAWPHLSKVIDDGTGTLDGRVGSLPLDPAAVMTTIGTGGLPYQHGITGALVRDDRGRLVKAWSAASPLSVIATLGDDLDDHYSQRASVALFGTSPSDRGAIGGNWYIGNDRDVVAVDTDATPARLVDLAKGSMRRNVGRDDVPDLVVIAMDGTIAKMDGALGEIEAALPEGAVLAVTATGSAAPKGAAPVEPVIDDALKDLDPGGELAEGIVPGGVFVDQDVLTEENLTGDEIVNVVKDARGAGGRVFADVFASLAVSFARYC